MSGPMNESLSLGETNDSLVEEIDDSIEQPEAFTYETPTGCPLFLSLSADPPALHYAVTTDDSHQQQHSPHPPPSFFLARYAKVRGTTDGERCGLCRLPGHRSTGCWYLWDRFGKPMEGTQGRVEAFKRIIQMARERELPLPDAAAIILPFFEDLDPNRPPTGNTYKPNFFIDPTNPFPNQQHPGERPPYMMLEHNLGIMYSEGADRKEDQFVVIRLRNDEGVVDWEQV